MLYKPDWETVKARLLAFWNHSILDRACIAIHAPRKNSRIPAVPDLQHGPWMFGMDEIAEDDEGSVLRWWLDPEKNLQRALTWFENTYFAGEALPVTYINWGAMSLAAMFGSPAKFSHTSVWYPIVINDWETWKWQFDIETNSTWLGILKILDLFIQEASGKFLVGKPELGNGADVLSLLRGMDSLAMDLITNPESVNQGVEVISDTWIELMECAYQLTTTTNDHGDVLAWMGLWAPGRVDQIACDFSSVISPAMFRKFFVPEIKKMGKWCDYGVYHLDGPSCMKHMLDILLDEPSIRMIQFTPGVGASPTYTPEYIPRYRKILQSGRNLYLLCQPDEVEKIMSELPPEGLFMRTYVNSEEHADELLRCVSRWSKQGNIFPVSKIPQI